MSEARRRLCHWLLTSFLERGVDPLHATRLHRRLPTHRARVLSREEHRALLGPRALACAQVRFLPHPRP